MYTEEIDFTLPSAQDIAIASERIEAWTHRTPLLSSERINAATGLSIHFKCENFQKVGAFKSRGAVNAVFSLSKKELNNGVCTHSSGNHAQALARAAQLKGIPAYIVMPNNAPQVKIDAVRTYGGMITFCEPNLAARESTLNAVQQQYGAVEIHPYDNLKIIEGQATAAREILEELPETDVIVCPVGGGGLLSGTLLANEYFGTTSTVIAAEPEMAQDAYQSIIQGKFIPSENPQTIADGLLTSLGRFTYPIINRYVNQILLASEETIKEALKLILQHLKIVVEPSSAVALAILLTHPEHFKNKNIVIILSGGNLELSKLNQLIP